MKYKPDYRDTMITQLKQRLAEVEKREDALREALEKQACLTAYYNGHSDGYNPHPNGGMFWQNYLCAEAREALNQRKEGETCATHSTLPTKCSGPSSTESLPNSGETFSPTFPPSSLASNAAPEKSDPPPVCGQTPRVDAEVDHVNNAYNDWVCSGDYPDVPRYVVSADFACQIARDLADTQSRCADLAEWNTKLTRERDAERDKALRVVRGEFAQICSYCGWEAKPEGAQWEELQAHIASCPAHPMRAVEEQRDTLRAIVEDVLDGKHVTSMRMQEALNP